MTKQKQICIVAVLVTFILGGGLFKYSNQIKAGNLFSFANKQSITANAQTTTPFVTIAVEQYTQNHLPNITGTCSIGNDMVFTIKKGSTGVVSETINKACTVSPYALTPTILLPDGKYRVDVSVTVASVCAVGSTIVGTTGKDTINGGVNNDIIYGNGGIDLLRGFACNDTIYAGSASNPNSAGNSNMYGDGGDDTLFGGGTGLNKLNGTNDTILGVGEKDYLYGGTTTGATSSVDTFVLGNINSSYYLGNGNNDFASIYNFNVLKDKIQLTGPIANFSTNYQIDNSTAGVVLLYFNNAGTWDLVAKIYVSTPLVITGSYFIQAPATIIL
jgi:Ca2+-binding RTX toxin-like protein